MSAVLSAAIRAQGAMPAIDPRQRAEDDARGERVRASSYRAARTTLAWCDAHPDQLRGFELYVAAVRSAVAMNAYVSRVLCTLWAEVPASVPVTFEADG